MMGEGGDGDSDDKIRYMDEMHRAAAVGHS